MKLLFAVLLVSPFGYSETQPVQKLAQVFSETVSGVDESFQQTQVDWQFNRFRLRFQLPIGFKIPSAAKIVIVPEVEFVWDRKNVLSNE